MNERDRWLNVAQAAQWLAEGRDIESRCRGVSTARWAAIHLHNGNVPVLYANDEYRLKPEPPKPAEIFVFEARRDHDEPWNNFGALTNPTDAEVSRFAHTLYLHNSGRHGGRSSANVRVRKFVETEMP